MLICSKNEDRNCSQQVSQQELHGTGLSSTEQIRSQNSQVTVLRFLPIPLQENNVIYTDTVVCSFLKKKKEKS